MIGTLENIHIDDTRDEHVLATPITNTSIGRFYLEKIYPHYNLHICRMVPERVDRLNHIWNGAEECH